MWRVCLILAVVNLSQPAGAQQVTITHGPMLGHVTSTTVRIWARTSRPAKFWVLIGDPKMTNVEVTSAPVETKLENDNTGWIEIKKLKPATPYGFMVITKGGNASRKGIFQTHPDPKQLADPKHNPRGLFNFSFEFACGNNQSPKHGLGPKLPTYDTLLKNVARNVDFAILNGDWLYEDARDYSPEKWHAQVGIGRDETPSIVKTVPPVVGVWENYKTYLSRAPNLAQWHREVPSYFTFDDHEIINDVFATGEVGYRNRRTVFRDPAVKAWFDYLGWANPTIHKQRITFGKVKMTKGSDIIEDRSVDFSKIDWKQCGNLHIHWGTANAGWKDLENHPKGDWEGGDPNAGVYEIVKVIGKHKLQVRPKLKATRASSYSIGRRSYSSFQVSNCRFYLLDTRSHRHLHNLKEPYRKGRSIIGKQQLAWLKNEMKTSKNVDFHFVVSSVNFMIPHVGGGGHHFDKNLKDDAWTAFLDERESLIKYFDSLGKPVFVLTGDLHNSFAVKVTDSVWEFASGPHNSVNHRPQDEGNRPINGWFKSGPRQCQIRWSSVALGDIPRENRLFPHYCVVQVNNIFNNPLKLGGARPVAFPYPQVIFKFYDGLTGKLKYSETITVPMKKPKAK